MRRSVLVLELNELCPPLIDRFIAAGDLPAFERLRSESIVRQTDAGEPQDHLNPWIQWVTVHTGVGFDTHKVFKLGEGGSLSVPTVADRVSAAGGTVWLCGPMNVVPTSPVRGRWLPDPWNPDEAPLPADMAPFARFVRANVQEHTNASRRLSLRAYAGFVAYIARHGLRPSTVWAVLRQLVGERTGRQARWRRAALLDRFQWDLFRHELRAARPTFATYFSNTTAHYQHLYWRYMDPAPFDVKPSAAELDTFGDAVRSGYQEMDRIVADALDLVGDDTTLVLCTALSQQPYLAKEAEGGSRFYRPHDIAGFASSLGLEGVHEVAPVMSEQFHLYFGDTAAAEAAEQALRGARVGPHEAFAVRRVGTDLFTGFAPKVDLPDDAAIDVPATGARVQVHEALYRSETPKSGFHHPAGAFWIRPPGGGPGVDGGTVPLQAVAPTLLALLDIEPPSTMAAPVAATGGADRARG